MLRDEKDWDPNTMIQVTESYGKMNPELKETLQTMKPKENSDQRKSRLRREAREANPSTRGITTKLNSTASMPESKTQATNEPKRHHRTRNHGYEDNQ